MEELAQADVLPQVSVLRAGKVSALLRHSEDVCEFSDRLASSRSPCRVVIELDQADAVDPLAMAKVLQLFRRSANRVDFSGGKAHLEESLAEAMAKYAVESEQLQRDPLGEARDVIGATRPLFSDNGRLSAKQIALAFGISLSKLATYVGRSKQAISKTPDSVGLQSDLRPFERIARLRAVFSEEEFLSWLNRPLWDLDNSSPLETIEAGEVTVVADFAEDMLLGNPA